MTNLTYTQALILLGIPEEEREEFIAEHDVESMTRVELLKMLTVLDRTDSEMKEEITVVLGDRVEASDFRHKYDSLQRVSKNLTAAHIKACTN